MVALVLAVVTSRAGTLRSRHPLPEGVQSPILALELVRDPGLVPQIARPPEPARPGDLPFNPPRDEPKQLVGAIEIDFAFIAAYTLFLVLIGRVIWITRPRAVAVLGVVVGLAGIVAGIFDVRENLAMLELLRTGAGAPRPLSLVKWGMLFVAILGAVPIFLDRTAPALRRTIGYIGVPVALFAGVEGLFAVYAGDDKLIESAAGRLGTAFLIAVVFITTNRTLREGLVPALDRLTRWRPLARLADWPSGDEGDTVGEPID